MTNSKFILWLKKLFLNGGEGFIVPIRISDALTEKLEVLAQLLSRRHGMGLTAMNAVKN